MRYEIRHDNSYVFDFYFDWENFKKYFNLRKVHLPNAEELWNKFRARFCPQIITKYGTVGRGIMPDERTRFEKVCDAISEYFYNRRQEKRYARATPNGFSFFDWCFATQITNLSQIKELEKKSGRTFMTWRDKEVEQAKANRYVVENQRRRIAKKLHHVFSEVRNGRRYTEEVKRGKEEFLRSFQG